ncbi:MAG: hypothetical protein V4507_15650 [Verrucomicrobiota bacterium]
MKQTILKLAKTTFFMVKLVVYVMISTMLLHVAVLGSIAVWNELKPVMESSFANDSETSRIK